MVLTAPTFKELAIGRRNYSCGNHLYRISSKSVTSMDSHLHPDDHQWADFDTTFFLEDILKRTYIPRDTTIPQFFFDTTSGNLMDVLMQASIQCTTEGTYHDFSHL